MRRLRSDVEDEDDEAMKRLARLGWWSLDGLLDKEKRRWRRRWWRRSWRRGRPRAETKVKEEKVDGYLECRQGDRADRGRPEDRDRGRDASFKGKEAAQDLASIPLGYEVKAKGPRQADGSLLASELEAKPNGSALFEKRRHDA